MSRTSAGRIYRRADRGGAWYVRIRRDGREVERKGGTTLREARKVLRKLEDEFAIGGPPKGAVTLREFAKGHEEFLENHLAPTSIRTHVAVLRMWVRELGAKPLRKITQADVYRVLKTKRGHLKPRRGTWMSRCCRPSSGRPSGSGSSPRTHAKV
jgi:hypothetical protein